MTQWLCRLLVWLHPPQFRRRFGQEMVWIYGVASAEEGSMRILADASVSLLRQWLFRSGAWKAAAACAGGLLPLAAGLALQLPVPRKLDSVGLDTPEAFFLLAATISVLAVSFTLILSVAWFRFSRRPHA